MTKAKKIAITIPPEDLDAADRLAVRLGRSRSWVLSEALRRFVAHERLTNELDTSRAIQLRRDLQRTAEQRVRESDVAVAEPYAGGVIEQPRRFVSYEDFVVWRKSGGHGG